MNEYLAEFIGTFLLILLGNGVVANVVLNETKGNNSGWIVITFGWGIAVFIAVFIVGQFSGAHINPAVTFGLALAGLFEWIKVVPYILAQITGAMLGAYVVYIFYLDHFKNTNNGELKKACFCTTPAIRNNKNNLFSELIGTFVLVFAVLYMSKPLIEIEGLGEAKVGLGALDALPVGLLVFGIGMSLGGTTGYAINPARDFGPRLVYSILPIRNEAKTDWGYGLIPIIGPLLGAGLATLIFLMI
ncbi:MIP/aquaporin family protein [Marinigracilibium pacificum]|uniref:Aquaporin family protein n=1 Tax=Marinigracilibium pacificum TaxID=2729599 RepID=A0A848IZ77_9BACT|nr:MIP/aquaporin family protein [Marinigracilibium pacificum]NMM48936.1 aquaporin family protein [Marinigracilibium pacificum]